METRGLFESKWKNFCAWMEESAKVNIMEKLQLRNKTLDDVIDLFGSNSSKIIFFADLENEASRRTYALKLTLAFEDEGILEGNEGDNLFDFMVLADKEKLRDYLHCLTDIAGFIISKTN